VLSLEIEAELEEDFAQPAAGSKKRGRGRPAKDEELNHESKKRKLVEQKAKAMMTQFDNVVSITVQYTEHPKLGGGGFSVRRKTAGNLALQLQ
jgi:hypothetical protein